MSTRDSRQEALRVRVAYWSQRLNVQPRVVRFQRMTRKWGSCSSRGILTLARDLINEDEQFQDAVIAHELLHLRVPNHGKVFRAVMSAHVPGWQNASTRIRRKE